MQVRHNDRRRVIPSTQKLRSFLHVHRLRHPKGMESDEGNACLSHLATDQQVHALSKTQPLEAVLFLYREMLGKSLRQ